MKLSIVAIAVVAFSSFNTAHAQQAHSRTICSGELAAFYMTQADVNNTQAHQLLQQMLALGSKPQDPTRAAKWEHVISHLQKQINQASANVSKLLAQPTFGVCLDI